MGLSKVFKIIGVVACVLGLIGSCLAGFGLWSFHQTCTQGQIAEARIESKIPTHLTHQFEVNLMIQSPKSTHPKRLLKNYPVSQQFYETSTRQAVYEARFQGQWVGAHPILLQDAPFVQSASIHGLLSMLAVTFLGLMTFVLARRRDS